MVSGIFKVGTYCLLGAFSVHDLNPVGYKGLEASTVIPDVSLNDFAVHPELVDLERQFLFDITSRFRGEGGGN